MVLYRKYRPQKFAELQGLEEIKKALISSKKADKIAHAYLFSGPRGTGKTTTARILAKIINCSNLGELGEPCNNCNSCQGITEGRFLDLLEIDAASNRGIEEIRDLREKIKLAPTQGEFKVYIIDEAHMLTQEAFNALLKTLEEPPIHAVFILCTTERHKLPATILSRCLKFEFKMPNQENLLSLLLRVAQEEGLSLDNHQASLIAKEARGAYRDALVLLEKFAATGKIEEVSESSFWQFMVHFVSGEKPKETIENLNSLIESGASLRVVLEGLLEVLRSMLLLKVGVRLSDFRYSNQEVEELESLTKGVTKERINFLIEILLRANEVLKVSPIPSLAMEIAIVEASTERETEFKSEEKTESSDTHPQKNSAQSQSQTRVNNESTSHPELVSGSKEIISDPNDKGKDYQTRSRSQTENPAQSQPKVDSELKPLDLKTVKSKWTEILEKIKPLNRSLESLLRKCEPQSLEDGFLVVKVFYKFHKGILEEAKNRNLVEKILSQYFETSVKIRCVLGEKRRKSETESETEEKDNSKSQTRSRSQTSTDEDLINLATDLFTQN